MIAVTQRALAARVEQFHGEVRRRADAANGAHRAAGHARALRQDGRAAGVAGGQVQRRAQRGQRTFL
ncbi:hypothetical protein G6F65_023067 [Rhizopus arrhizus]|nr:hypothetical protein G6F65_023067 [Rhizopus arrhizus]